MLLNICVRLVTVVMAIISSSTYGVTTPGIPLGMPGVHEDIDKVLLLYLPATFALNITSP
jgi:hypothetical protein